MEHFPYAWVFFISFILVATFTMLNLFTAIIVNAMQSYSWEEQRNTIEALDRTREPIEADLHAEVRGLRSEIQDLKALLAGSETSNPSPVRQPGPENTAGTSKLLDRS